MPKFSSPEAKERWLQSVRATKAAKKAARENVPVSRPSVGGGGIIAGAIEEIDSKIAALENLKRQLRHAQELVNL